MLTMTAVQNNYIDALRDEVTKCGGTLDCLIVAHNDCRLTPRLQRAFDDESAALLLTHQEDWDLTHGDLIDAIKWAIEEEHAGRILLVGDSSASVPAEWGNSDSPAEAVDSGNNVLLRRVRVAEAARAAAQGHFVAQLKELLTTPCIASRVSDGTLVVNGLFFRAETGAFAMFDTEDDTFRILG